MRPNYYKVEVMVYRGGEKFSAQLECFDLIDALGGGFYMGNAIKYLFRAGRKAKDRAKDLTKCITYIRQVMLRDREKGGALIVEEYDLTPKEMDALTIQRLMKGSDSVIS